MVMKNYGKLMPVVMVVLLALSYYVIVSNKAEVNNEYENYLNEAREYAKTGITVNAVASYQQALKIKPTADVYVEVAEYYKSQKDEERNLLEWCQDFYNKYPTEPKAYDCLLSVYKDQSDYKSCYDVIYTAEKRNINTDYITSVKDEIAFKYNIEMSAYDDVGVYSSNYCAVKGKESWGFVNRYGDSVVSVKYTSVAPYTQENIAPVTTNDDAYFINKSGSRILATNDKYKSFGIMSGSRTKALTTDDKYTYLNEKLEPAFGKYVDATAFNLNVAAVKETDKWKIIDADGNQLFQTEYDDVIVDEKDIAFRNDRLFVRNTDGVIMIDSSGNKIGTDIYEDAKLFADSTFTAVKNDGKWFYINNNGERKSDKTYEDARPFSNGLAAVMTGGKWGFIDENENIVIEPQFFGTKDFNDKGSCFIQTGDKWQLLKLYRLNREE